MTHVRRHTRELPSGKTANVRQHERSGESRGRDTADDWWDRREDPQDVSGDHPEGTTFFRQDDQILAVHPDGTVHAPADEDDGSAPTAAGWQYCNCEGSHRPRCPNDRPGGLPPLNDSPDET
jgi:hypothetical protein